MCTTLDYFELTGHFGTLKGATNMPAKLSLEQQLPHLTPEQEQRCTELMAKIEEETTAYRKRIQPYEAEISAILREATLAKIV